MWVLVLGLFMFLSGGFPGFSLVLDPRHRLGGTVGSDCEVIVSENSGAGSSELFG